MHSPCPCCHPESCSPRHWHDLLPQLLRPFLKCCLPGESFLTILFKLHSMSLNRPTPFPDLNFSIALTTIQYTHILCVYMTCLFVPFISDPPPLCLLYKQVQHTEKCLAWEGTHRVCDEGKINKQQQNPGGWHTQSTHSKEGIILTNG